MTPCRRKDCRASRVSPETAAVVLAADAFADAMQPMGELEWLYEIPARDATRLKRAVLALRKKRENEK